MHRRPDHHFTGTTHFVTTTTGRRILRITVDERLHRDRRAAALAHELQHAVEVARYRSVIDQVTFKDRYRAIGYPSGADPHANCFETSEALRVGETVRTKCALNGRRHVVVAPCQCG